MKERCLAVKAKPANAERLSESELAVHSEGESKIRSEEMLAHSVKARRHLTPYIV